MLTNPGVYIVLGGIVLILGSLFLFFQAARRTKKSHDIKPPDVVEEKIRPASSEPSTRPLNAGLTAKLEPLSEKLVLTASEGREYLIEALPVTIGSSPECRIVLQDEGILSQHACLEMSPLFQSLIVRTLDPAALLRVNGQPTCKNIVRPGDMLQFGDTNFVLRDSSWLDRSPQPEA